MSNVTAIADRLNLIKTYAAEIEAMLASGFSEGTAADSGLSCDEVTQIVLQKIVKNGGSAYMDDLYHAVERKMNARGWSLSFNGRASLRRLVNETAVMNGFIEQHDPSRPGWRITRLGRAALS